MKKFLEEIEEADLVLIGIGEECNRELEECKKIYEMLEKILQNKNYFIVSTNVEGSIYEYNFKKDRITEPCGSYFKLQCPDACNRAVYQTKDMQENADCPICGKSLVYNICTQENYVEEGYMEQWGVYTKWLQGTLNKKLCILELGVSLKYPTVIRWPFEKIAFFNQKAVFFRVHSILAHLSEELSENAIGVFKTPYEFLKNIQ